MSGIALRIEHLTRTYGNGDTLVTAIRDVSLTVAAGEIVLIMGPSGSGKTTLLSMLGGLLRPSDGSIYLNEVPISQLDEQQLPRIRLHQIGFIFQDFNLLAALTAVQNVAIVGQIAGMSRRAAAAKAAGILGDLGLAGRLDFLPEQLSGGEKQRVAIGRAFMNDPSLILADEPTANLDSRIGQEIARLLRRVAKAQERSVVIVSHDQRLREIADRILWLEDGQFRDLTTMATDPVCGMAIDRDQSPSAVVGGRTYHFCSRGCRDEFLSLAAASPVSLDGRVAGEDGT